MSKTKTFWPYGILLSIFAIILACIVTIVFASNYPVYEDDFYFDKYQNVESNFDKIQQKQAEFNKFFNVNLELDEKFDKKDRPFYELYKDQNNIMIFIKELSDLSASDIKTSGLLTRPHTNKQDKNLDLNLYLANEPIANENGVLNKGLRTSLNTYALNTILPELENGRWQLKLKLEKDENTIGFFSFNLFVQ
ncbi:MULTISPECIES: hypothetical protein [unclassified Campylobacter]|uniref:hypothetical protein n=1 Tax=unclassified Campylobacter TaxID=2593542 RepID=UPI001237EF49|nr:MULTISPECIES: hypothetical protein [unclassified Campylobacter]KAA6224604.1 hypothetical protein FMM54_08115 [Campylobacter sp. LR185c]KAA6224846.1 hypothetical protein FMM57_08390 [Campylobacter sp. LR286c]KAA6227993.1 hypothetical protein FMM55_02160 [Campylobacter sp. LR196d]KAA6233474.1 hypothetical protein FMM58_02085 [Campylobacter sp. LR291e]KAA6234411.1 hypothetical protein FMM56_00790 [Campylobacter sp. LR264d]